VVLPLTLRPADNVTALPVAFRSAEGKYKFIGTTQLVNAYAEKQGDDGKGSLAVIPTEGLLEHADTEAGPGRGLIYLEDLDKLYSIHPGACYLIDEAGTATRIGTVPGIDPVQLSRNQKADPEVFVQSSGMSQVISSDTLAPVIHYEFPDDVVTSDYVSGYTLAGLADRSFFKSDLNDSTQWDALEYATFEQRAGKLIRIKEHAGELFGFCSSWLEIWRDTGNADFPFEPLGWKSRGLKAANAVVSSDNTLMFPGDDNNIYRLNNYEPGIISTHEVSRLIQDDAAGEDISGFSYDRDGHAFACFTGSDWTMCYDSATQVWHRRKSYGYDRWRAQYSVKAWGKTLVQDRLSGKILYLDKDTFTEDGSTMVWQVVSPPMHAFPNGGIVDALHLDIATGYGSLGSTPKVMLETSVDGGNVFTQYRELSLGTPGQYQARVTARRLGRFGPKGMVFRVSVSDTCARGLVNVDAEVRGLKR
jgi:hypothetical protein